jgi:hypothetical protein
LKSKLPFKKKKEEEDGEEDVELSDDEGTSTSINATADKTGETDISSLEEAPEDTGASKSLIVKLKAKLASLSKKPKKEDDVSEEEGAEVAPTKGLTPAKKKRIIQVAIVLGLVVFLLSDYIFPPDETVEAPAPAPIKKKYEKKKPAEQAADVKLPEDKPTETEVPTEPQADASVETNVATTPADEAPATEFGEEDPVIIADPGPSDSSLGPTFTDSSKEGDLQLGDSSSADQDTVDADLPATNDDAITDKILEDLEKEAKKSEPRPQITEYVSPPDYEYRGRGLVYNCKGKHWACVDGPSYKSCEDNNSSVKYLKKPIECYPFNVYENQKGCENMQNRMVSSSAKTTFCQE